jgi:prepilin-type N-terminal cleavage/methylation domain-containing protein
VPAWPRHARRFAAASGAASPRGRAFTLLEVLIVVAIVAVMLTMLVPTWTRAKAIARLVLCKDRLRQWHVAFGAYAAQNGGVYPHIDGLDRGKGVADRFGWIDVLPPLMGVRPWRDHSIHERPGAETIFQCPAARPLPDNAYRYRPSRVGYFSYAMNSCLELDADCPRAPGDGGRPMPGFLKVSRIETPGRAVLLFDQLLDVTKGYNATTLYRDAGKYCGSYPKAFAARHARRGRPLGGCILYCDGHADRLDSVWKPSWPADLEVPPRDDEDWFPYPPRP